MGKKKKSETNKFTFEGIFIMGHSAIRPCPTDDVLGCGCVFPSLFRYGVVLSFRSPVCGIGSAIHTKFPCVWMFRFGLLYQISLFLPSRLRLFCGRSFAVVVTAVLEFVVGSL